VKSFRRVQILRFKFILSFIIFYNFLRKNKALLEGQSEIKTEGSYVVVLSPWSLTTTPWFNITLALILSKRGHTIQFLIDDLQFENTIDHNLQINLIKIALRSIRKMGLKIDTLSSLEAVLTIDENEHSEIKKSAFANAIHKNRGEEDSQYFKSNIERNEKILMSNFAWVKLFVENNKHKTFILSGGIYANSCLFELLLKAQNREYFTFDSGFGVLMSSYKGIASQLSDIPMALELLLSKSDVVIENIVELANQEFEKRQKGINKLNSQYESIEHCEYSDEVGILIPLNSPWDAAALNIASVFSSYNEWLLDTVGLILENTDFIITIRQHPDERHWWGRTKSDFNHMLRERYTDNRIKFVSCYDKVNTYTLLRKSRAVICYSSTIGIEAAMIGKNVCVCSKVYYSKLGFTFVPSSRHDIVLFLKSIYTTSSRHEQMTNAYLTFYLSQCCNWLFTSFTPNYDDFLLWVKKDLQNIWDDKANQIYFESLETRLPLSYLCHLNSYN
jgi:hypothetical protein